MEVSHTAARSYNTGALTKLLTDIDGWRAGGDGDGAPAIFDFMTIVLQSGYTPAVKWLLGEGKAGSLLSDFAQRDIINAPLKWPAYFIDTMTLDENDEREEALSDLDEVGYSLGDSARTCTCSLELAPMTRLAQAASS